MDGVRLLQGGVLGGALGCLWPWVSLGVAVVGGLLGFWGLTGVGVWVPFCSWISPLWGVPELWPQGLLLGPWWIADRCGVLGCLGLWVPWGSHLGFSVLEWPLPHS